MKITLENGKEVKISKESYKALVEASKEEEGNIVPLSIAQYDDYYGFILKCTNDICSSMCCGDDGGLRVVGYHYDKVGEPNLKLVKVNSINDIKVGDLVRFTELNNWNEEDFNLKLVTKIRNNRITLQYFYDGHVSYCGERISDYRNWQVSRRIE